MRLLHDGKILDPSGFKITSDGSGRWQRNVSVAARGEQFLVVWEEYHNETARDIYGARVDWDGEVLDPDGIALAVAEGAQEGPEAASEGGDYLVVWETRNPSNDDYEIRGSIVPGEGDLGDPKSLLITAGENWRAGADVGSNGEVYLAAWQDGRNSRERGDDVYGARIGSGGEVLDKEAFPISGAAESQREPTVAGGQNGFFVAWRDGRNGRDGDIFGARVAEGSVMDSEGMALAVGETPQVRPQATSDGEDYLIGWIRGERQKRIGVVKFAQGGEVEQLDRPNIWRHPEEHEESFSLTGGGESFLMTRLTVDRGKGRIRFSSFDRKTSPLSDQFIPTLDHEQGAARVAGTPNGALVVWKDWRQGGANADLWAARISPTGEILNPKGLPIAVKAGEPLNFEVATDGLDYLVAWAEQNVGTELDIYATVVTADGEVLHAGGLQITEAAENQNDPAIASNGKGYLVAWADKRHYSDRRYDLYGVQLDAKGEHLNEENVPLITEESSQLMPALAAQGTGFFLAWQDSRTVTPSGPDPAIYGTLLSADGAVLDPGGERIDSHDDTSEHPAVATIGERSVVAWQEEVGEDRYEVHGSWITRTDEGFETGSPGEPLVSVDGTPKAPRIAGAEKSLLLTWYSLPSDEGEPAEIGVMPLRTGEPMEGVAGLSIDTSQSPKPLPDVAAMGKRYLMAFGDRLKGRRRLQSRLVAVDQPLLYLQNSRIAYLPGAETMSIAPDVAVRLPPAIDRGRLTLEATIASLKGVGESLQLRGEASGGPAKLTIESDKLLYDGTVVGSWSSDSEDAGALSVAFNEAATDAAIGAVIRAVGFASDLCVAASPGSRPAATGRKPNLRSTISS